MIFMCDSNKSKLRNKLDYNRNGRQVGQFLRLGHLINNHFESKNGKKNNKDTLLIQ